MRYLVETGCDGAMLCVFDASALPPDFDRLMEDDPADALEQLQSDGRLWSVNTEGDGGYLFHFYVDEEVPSPIREHLGKPTSIERFRVPGGTVWAHGAEYAALDPLAGHAGTPAGGLGKYPHMGGRFTLPPGEYALKAWGVDWPEGTEDSALKKRLGPAKARIENAIGVLTGVLLVACLIGLVLLLVSLLSGRWTALAWIAGTLGVLALAAWPLMRYLKKIENDPRRREVLAQFPAYVVQLTRRRD